MLIETFPEPTLCSLYNMYAVFVLLGVRCISKFHRNLISATTILPRKFLIIRGPVKNNWESWYISLYPSQMGHIFAINCDTSEYAIYEIMQRIRDYCCLAITEYIWTLCVHAAIKRCHRNTIQNNVTPFCVFVADKVFEYTFVKCNRLNWGTGILFHKNGEIKAIFGTFHLQIYPTHARILRQWTLTDSNFGGNPFSCLARRTLSGDSCLSPYFSISYQNHHCKITITMRNLNLYVNLIFKFTFKCLNVRIFVY